MRAWYAGLFGAGLALVLAAAVLQAAPGYMDADYYYAGALRIAAGQGASEPYLWNYLNAPAGLPAPSFAYWMPLVSLTGALGLKLAGGLGWWGARLPFFLLAALVPPLTAALALRLTGKAAHGRLAGLLALFPAFYLPYLPTTDAFALLMVLGASFLLLVFTRGSFLTRQPPELRWFLLGLLAGLFHLARADGLLWLALLLLVIALTRRRADLRLFSGALAALLGYGLVMAPWFARNLGEWGSLLPPGGGRAMWITAYEQTMIFPAALLTPSHWLAAGWGEHLRAWGMALSANLQTTVAVQGMVVLLPFSLAGLWQLRRCPEVRLGALAWLLTAAAMTFIFPYAGANGGFFHSGAALQPLWWAAAPLGVETLASAYTRWRRLPSPMPLTRFFSFLLVGLAVLLSIALYARQVIGVQPEAPRWNASQAHYRAVEQRLLSLGAQPGEALLVNNPPGYWLASGRPAAVIPFGDENTLLAAARLTGARYVVLEANNPYPLIQLYTSPQSQPGLEYLDRVDTTLLFRIRAP